MHVCGSVRPFCRLAYVQHADMTHVVLPGCTCAADSSAQFTAFAEEVQVKTETCFRQKEEIDRLSNQVDGLRRRVRQVFPTHLLPCVICAMCTMYQNPVDCLHRSVMFTSMSS